MRRAVIFLLFLLFLPLAAPADVINVPTDQPTIQTGINAAVDGDTVLVASGTYTGQGNKNLNFHNKAITVRSARGPSDCIIDCGGNGRGFYFESGEGPDSVVKGFTIRNGFHSGGGGIYCWNNSSPTITGNVITGNSGNQPGGGICIYGSSPTIVGNTISDNTLNWDGGGIFCSESHSLISGNIITGNSSYSGGGIHCWIAAPTIIGNVISFNSAVSDGGGICCQVSSPEISNNVLFENSAVKGGAICILNASPTVANCTLTVNSATQGGGIYCEDDSVPTVLNCILCQDVAPFGKEIFLGTEQYPSSLAISWSDVVGGEDSVHVAPGCLFDWGEGMIVTDPLFVSGQAGDYYLSQTACGQSTDSPCVDSGSDLAENICFTTEEGTVCMDQLTTCGDSIADGGQVDMGFHSSFFLASGPLIIAGPGPGPDNSPLVRVFPPQQDAEPILEFSAYGAPHYGVKVTCNDVDGDLFDEILTGAGPGDIYGPHVRGFTVTGTPLPGLSFLAYGTSKYGVNVSSGDIDGDGYAEIITGAGPGAVFGPHVRGWNYDGSPGVSPVPGVSYFAYGTPKWGVNVSAGDIDGDGFDEIVTGAGPGAIYGPHVRGWNVDGGAAAAMPGCSFFAYGTNRMGVNVTCGDVDGDGIDEIITGPGPSPFFGAHIRGFEMNGAPLPGLSFFAWPPAEVRYGAKVFAGADLNGNGRNEIVVGQGPDPEASGEVTVFEYDGTQVTEWFSLEAFPGMTHGTNVAAGRF